MWDYPRPPRLEPFEGSITIELGGQVIASTSRGWRVLETSHPPTYYLPPAAFADGVLRDAPGSSWCEWKGQARYYDLVTDTTVAPQAAWTYPKPTRGFEQIAGAIAVMAAQVEAVVIPLKFFRDGIYENGIVEVGDLLRVGVEKIDVFDFVQVRIFEEIRYRAVGGL
mgnify:CR=1 FL=1